MSPGESEWRIAACAMAACMVSMLTGCGFGGSVSPAAAPLPLAGVALQGKVHGGQQPVSGATIQLYAAGAAGYGSAATPLIGATVKTDANGNFTITSSYTCPTASTNVYITSTGGNPGLASANANIVLMAALGRCGALSASTFISINEVTTVGAVWALAPFLSGPANVGTSAANAAGLNDAFDNAALLVNTSTGAAPGNAGAGVTVPAAELNTLANILAACVNSTGGVAGDMTACGKFFQRGESRYGTDGHCDGGAEHGAESRAECSHALPAGDGDCAVPANAGERAE